MGVMMGAVVLDFTYIRGDIYVNIDRLIAEIRDVCGDPQLLDWLETVKASAQEHAEKVYP